MNPNHLFFPTYAKIFALLRSIDAGDPAIDQDELVGVFKETRPYISKNLKKALGILTNPTTGSSTEDERKRCIRHIADALTKDANWLSIYIRKALEIGATPESITKLSTDELVRFCDKAEGDLQKRAADELRREIAGKTGYGTKLKYPIILAPIPDLLAEIRRMQAYRRRR